MTHGLPSARFAAAVRARYAGGPGRLGPFAAIVRRAPKSAVSVALQRLVHVSVTTTSPVVLRSVERSFAATPVRGDTRAPASRTLVVERLLTRRERVERRVDREIVRHAPGLAPPSPPPPASAGASSSPAARRWPAPARMAPPPPVALDVERLTADVIRAIDRRIIAQRERLGRV